MKKQEIQKIVQSLHPLERKVLHHLKDNIFLSSIVKKTKLSVVEVMRALQWLENKKIIELKQIVTETVELGENGKAYAAEGLPEKELLRHVSHRALPIQKLKEKSKLGDQEFNISLGILKKNVGISIDKGVVSITDNGMKYLEKQSLEEAFIKKLEFGPVPVDTLADEERYAFDSLKRRKNMLKIQKSKDWEAKLTDYGDSIIRHSSGLDDDSSIDKLTPEMIRKGTWESARFRRYDISINVPKRHGGKKHPYNEFIQDVKQILLRMGFVEMTGPIVESEFFNFDALFQPQNHPARTWSATYRIKDPKSGDLPDKKIVDSVRAAHENGGNTGSTGWGYKWDPKIAMQLMPRAHDTAISPRYMAGDIKVPGKYFSLVRCYRPDVIDSTHGVEFNQMGGIVIGKGLSFKHLLGLLRDCAFELTGAKEAKFFPDYFPFTEPSVQISVKHPQFGWLELAGAGVFRPELCVPLGVKEPVIAWGFGLERLAMLKLGIKDIRNLFSHDLNFLRESKKYYSAGEL